MKGSYRVLNSISGEFDESEYWNGSRKGIGNRGKYVPIFDREICEGK